MHPHAFRGSKERRREYGGGVLPVHMGGLDATASEVLFSLSLLSQFCPVF